MATSPLLAGNGSYFPPKPWNLLLAAMGQLVLAGSALIPRGSCTRALTLETEPPSSGPEDWARPRRPEQLSGQTGLPGCSASLSAPWFGGCRGGEPDLQKQRLGLRGGGGETGIMPSHFMDEPPPRVHTAPSWVGCRGQGSPRTLSQESFKCMMGPACDVEGEFSHSPRGSLRWGHIH